MAVNKFDFMRIAESYGLDKAEALRDYDFMMNIMKWDLTKMTPSELEEYYEHQAKLKIVLGEDKK